VGVAVLRGELFRGRNLCTMKAFGIKDTQKHLQTGRGKGVVCGAA